jgi:maltose alpha-D-glucosyltransferase / alpha-amylase
MPRQQPWYRDAVIYAIDVEKFADGNGDGIGDFEGLIDHIDYLDWLGVTCLWLLPFYTSPRRDNGYDVADHYQVDPRFGTLDDFDRLVRTAGERGIRVMLDIVMDHTSDEHPWFQASRRHKHTRYRDYYTWVDMPPKGGLGHGSAFPGEEYSLWKYDALAGQYYYHPFYRFQPQLNMRNREVCNELMRVLDYWQSFGVAGFRLDAVPLMLGLDGPAINPPRDPHGILKEAREVVQGTYEHSALMGEVDLAAGRLIGYFGDGDELNCLLNFTVNNYLFLAFAQESAKPILRGLRLLPLPPEGCQWVNFLRNLDELNIQWLPEEDRHFVWDTFAPDPDMRIYMRGIRRRLAPMINDPKKLEMAFSLLMALPGTPMIVYGDEIGIGERLDQPGRDAVRIPMQWSAEKNAGFSAAAESSLVRPLVDDGPFSYTRVNVEAQHGDPSSLLEAVRNLIRARRECIEIGRGAWQVLETESEQMLVYQCTWRDSLILLAHNLGAHEQSTVVDLRDHRGETISLVVGKCNAYEELERKRYRINLPPYGYAWYRVTQDAEFSMGGDHAHV